MSHLTARLHFFPINRYCSHLMSSAIAKRKRQASPDSDAEESFGQNGASGSSKGSGKSPAKKSSGFLFGLLTAMKDPKLILRDFKDVVVIKDKFPKAKFHFLVLPKADIADLGALNRSHSNLLERMDSIAREAATDFGERGTLFRFGYHSVASMNRLHLHVISQDFDSACLKTKKHWLSFTSDFFKDSAEVMRELDKNGKISIDAKQAESLLKGPLKCHRCSFIAPNIPKLKSHLQQHSRS